MFLIRSCHWGWILSAALLFPAALPAGGGAINEQRIRERNQYEPLISIHGWQLLSAPSSMAPSLKTLSMGTPLRILHSWHNEVGKEWIYVEMLETLDEKLFLGNVKRGWLNV